MIHSLSGKLVSKNKGVAVIDVNGIGFQVLVSSRTLASLSNVGESVVVFCSLKFQRESFELYGFLTERELVLFESFNSISGIGVKAALKILETEDPEKLIDSIKNGNINALTNISGIGRKKALRIMMEMQDKFIETSNAEMSALLKENSDLEKALKNLGYSKEEIKEAIRNLSDDLENLEDKLKAALKFLGTK